MNKGITNVGFLPEPEDIKGKYRKYIRVAIGLAIVHALTFTVASEPAGYFASSVLTIAFFTIAIYYKIKLHMLKKH